MSDEASPPRSTVLRALPVWIDGELRERHELGLPADDSSVLEGRGCYSTALVAAGRVRWLDAHVARLRRDAERLALPSPDAALLGAALEETGRASFGEGDGAVRVSVSADARGAVHILAVPRALGDEAAQWTAVTAPFPHPGPQPWRGAKLTGQPLYGFARSHARETGANESLLCDAAGLAVEGSRSNWLVVDEAGRLSAFDLALGGVHGLALEHLRSAIPELPFRSWRRDELATARELIAVNSLRGARAVVSIDGQSVGEGATGPEAQRLDAILASEPPPS